MTLQEYLNTGPVFVTDLEGFNWATAPTIKQLDASQGDLLTWSIPIDAIGVLESCLTNQNAEIRGLARAALIRINNENNGLSLSKSSTQTLLNRLVFFNIFSLTDISNLNESCQIVVPRYKTLDEPLTLNNRVIRTLKLYHITKARNT